MFSSGDLQQGEGAALSRKGVCANHIKDVSGFFKGAHITITARNEDEVEPAIILEKVSKSSATKLNLKDRSDPIENAAPVGTNYTRIQPAREINSVERESFWTKQQEEERRRKIEERKRVESDRKKLEECEKLRELHEAKEREQLALQKERDLSRRREEEKNAENRARDLLEERKLSTNDDEDEDPEEERMRRAEVMRQSRADEARSLVSGRSTIRNARAVFEQTDQTQISKGPVLSPKSPAVASSVSAARQLFMQNTESQSSPTDRPISDAVNRSTVTTTKSSPKSSVTNGSVNGPAVGAESLPDRDTSNDKVAQVALEPKHETEHLSLTEDNEMVESDSELALREDALKRAVYNDIPVGDHILEDIQEESEGKLVFRTMDTHSNLKRSPVTEVEDDADKLLASASKSEHGIRARALYDYQAGEYHALCYPAVILSISADETEISFDPDDIIAHVDMIDPGWYQGMAPDGSYGLFPANYVEIIIDAP